MRLLLFFLCIIKYSFSIAHSNDSSLVYVVLSNPNIMNIGVMQFDFSPSVKYKFYPVNNKSFKISLPVNVPSIVRINNKDFVIISGYTYYLEFDSLNNVKADSLNILFLKYQAEVDSVGASFYKKYKSDTISKNYFSLVKKGISEIESKLLNVSDENLNKLIQNYINGRKLFLLSYPFVKGNYNFLTLNDFRDFYHSTFQDNNFQLNYYTVLAMENYFIKGLFPKFKKVSSLFNSKYWDINDSLKILICSKLIHEYSRNNIQLSESDLILIKSYLCKNNSIKNDFCDYYSSRTDPSKILYSDLIKNDTLQKYAGERLAWKSLQNKNLVHIYIWASWCSPCISFMKTLNMKKIYNDSNVIFLSVDNNITAWKSRSKNLAIPDNLNYLLVGGMKSNFAKKVQLIEVPRILSYMNNYESKKFSKQQIFSKYLIK